MADEKEPWDAEEIYDMEFSPKVAELIELAKRHNLPLFLTVQYADDGQDDQSFCTSNVPGTRSCPTFRRLLPTVRGELGGPPLMAFTITTTKAPADG